MTTTEVPPDAPAEFRDALEQAALAGFRSELRVFETAAPQGLAPFQKAWAADVEPTSTTDDNEYVEFEADVDGAWLIQVDLWSDVVLNEFGNTYQLDVSVN